ncbi:FMN-binding negative transcriptional regulator [Streptomyces sp. NPDC001868]|uniref:FMN-binding negative transcriptional regulator n=1 Tax=Streptomyces sp. NPDC001868 TaxID=3154401 RepID=UPI0033204325
MFVPDPYREPDGSWMTELIRLNPFALLVSNGPADADPYATHLPVLRDPEWTGEWTEDLAGGRLIGHMNRENPHWTALESGTPVLITFTGPHAYVSPTVYDITPAAPTWDFTSVHVHGVFHKIEAAAPGEDSLEVCKDTVKAYERDFGAAKAWDMSRSIDYFATILPAVGAFRVEVTGAEGMFKLSQEQDEEIRDRVREDFALRDSTQYRETAGLMDRMEKTGTIKGCPVHH